MAPLLGDPSDISILEPRTAKKLAAVEVTADVVLKRSMKLKMGKSCGPDEINPRLLCELAEPQAAHLLKLVNKSLQSRCITGDWKLATGSPIFKKGSKKMSENYRPVSLTSIVCKLLESVVRGALL